MKKIAYRNDSARSLFKAMSVMIILGLVLNPLMFFRTAKALNEIIIINNEDPAYTEISGSWGTSTNQPGLDNTGTRYSTTAGACAQWTPQLDEGTYKVSVYKVLYSSSDPAAKLVIRSASGDTEKTFDLTKGSKGWTEIGTFRFNAGTDGYIRMYQTTAGTSIRTDAVKFEKISPLSFDSPVFYKNSIADQNKITDNKFPYGSIVGTVNITHNKLTDQPLPATLIMALYNGDRLVNISTSSYSISYGEKKPANVTMNVPVLGQGNYYMEFFAWDSKASMQPLMQAVQLMPSGITIPSEEDTIAPVISLIGNAEIILPVGAAYTELGATASDNVDGDLTAAITKSGTVDVNTAGPYTITYRVSDAAGNTASAIRTVTVTNEVPDIIIDYGQTGYHEYGTWTESTSLTGWDGSYTRASKDVSAYVTWTPTIAVAGDYDVWFYKRTHNSTTSVSNAPLEVVYNGAGSPYSTTVNFASGTVGWINLGKYNFTEGTNGYVKLSVPADAGTKVARADAVKFVKVSEQDTTPPVITINGQNPVTLTAGESYTDAGATASDNKDGDLTSAIVVTGSVNTNIEGSYTITYTVTDAAGNTSQATRTVNVEAGSSLDTTPPVIALIGDPNITLTVGTAYVEQGATATDNVSGDLTGSIIISGTVDTNTPGSYSITYSVSDAAGNVATVTRTVNVTSGMVPDIIIDNGQPGYAESGTWLTSTTLKGYTGSDDTRYSNTLGSYATWTPTIPVAGTYEVWIYKRVYNNCVTNAPLEVVYNGGAPYSMTLNLASGAAGWVKISEFDFAAGTGGYVKLSLPADAAGKYIRTDAVKFVKK